MTYADAMARYGTDKPDLRFGLELADLTGYFADTPFRVFQAPYVGAVVHAGRRLRPHAAGFDAWQEWAKQRGAKGLAYVTVAEDGSAGRPGREEPHPTPSVTGWSPQSALSRATRSSSPRARHRRPARCSVRPRLEIARRTGSSTTPSGPSCGLSTRRCSSRPARTTTSRSARVRGPPCTTRSPHPSRSGSTRFESDPGNALAYAYDIVCNGNEIGGGSIRIHRQDVQKRVFDVMGLDEDGGRSEKFGWFLDAFAYGAPPHGGIAFGFDRILALLTGWTRSGTSSRSRSRVAATTRSPARRRRSRRSSARRPASTRRLRRRAPPQA